jgi:hypothetical protein
MTAAGWNDAARLVRLNDNVGGTGYSAESNGKDSVSMMLYAPKPPK